jgi:hypothetical protein
MTQIVNPKTKEDRVYTSLGDMDLLNFKQLQAYLNANTTIRNSVLTGGTIALTQSVNDGAVTEFVYNLIDFEGNTQYEGGVWSNGRLFTPAKILGIWVLCQSDLESTAFSGKNSMVEAEMLDLGYTQIFRNGRGADEAASANTSALCFVPVVYGQTTFKLRITADDAQTTFVIQGIQHRGT